MSDTSLSLILDSTPDLPSAILQALYRTSGRSTVELRRSIQRREPIFTVTLFGNDHIMVVPRFEKTAAYLAEIGLPFTVHENVDGVSGEISLETMRNILEGADGQFE